MEYVWMILFLIMGFVFLVKGADLFVDGSSNIAKRCKVPAIIIGLTIVALGTSLPEVSVSISASFSGANNMAVSNVLGSNLFNTLVVLGASAIFCPVIAEASALKREIPFSVFLSFALIASLLLGFAPITDGVSLLDALQTNSATFRIGRLVGTLLLLFFVLYISLQVYSALKARKAQVAEEEDAKAMPLWKSILFIIIGIAGIILGGNLVVDGATRAAQMFGMSETLIGLTIVAIGTSLPELVTSVVAARKGESDLALGNAIGSNIFNIVFVLGFSALVSPMTVDTPVLYDAIILAAVSILCLVFAKTRRTVSRLEGAVMVGCYVVYMVYIILR